jgi:isochorismate hydrolase
VIIEYASIARAPRHPSTIADIPDILCPEPLLLKLLMSVRRFRVAASPTGGDTHMTTLQNRPNTALLVIDVQTGVVTGNHDRDAVVANIGTLVEKARREQVPVVWVQHNDGGLERGSDGWQIVPELSRDEAEPLVEKTYGDSFEDTTLEKVLSGLGVGRLVVVGAQTDMCIRSTLHGALVRGYDATLVGDAHTTEDLSEYGAPTPDKVIAHTNLYWGDQKAPGRTGGTVETKDVDFG